MTPTPRTIAMLEAILHEDIETAEAILDAEAERGPAEALELLASIADILAEPPALTN